ncbi:MAG: hypothetical protein AB8G95_22775 [Anaerolineae bacterium]
MSVEPQLPIKISPTPQSVSVILVEEHQKVRAALTQSFMNQPAIRLVHAMPYLPSRPEEFLERKPNVILVGYPQQAVTTLPTLIEHIKIWTAADIASVILAPYLDPDIEDVLFKSGVFAHLHKTIDIQKLGSVISMASSYFDKP